MKQPLFSAPGKIQSARWVLRRNTVLWLFLAMVLVNNSPIMPLLWLWLGNTQMYGYYVIAFLIVGFVFMFPRVFNNQRLNGLTIVLLGVFTVNFLFAEHSVLSWFAHQIAYLSTTWYIASLYSGLRNEQLQWIFSKIQKVIGVAALFLWLCAVWLMFANFQLLIAAFGNGDFNSYIYLLTEQIQWPKIWIGYFLATVLLFYVTTRNLAPKNLFLLLVWGVPLGLLGLGIRSAWIGLGLSALFLLTRIKPKWVIFALLVGFLGIAILPSQFRELLQFDRMASIATGWKMAMEFPFGYGNGSFHLYVAENQSALDAEFRYLFATYQTGVFYSPESNIAYVLGSFGLPLGLALFATQVGPLIRLWNIYPRLQNLDRFFGALFLYYTFAGISSTSMFNYEFWIVMGFGLGVVLASRNQKTRSQIAPSRTELTCQDEQG